MPQARWPPCAPVVSRPPAPNRSPIKLSSPRTPLPQPRCVNPRGLDRHPPAPRFPSLDCAIAQNLGLIAVAQAEASCVVFCRARTASKQTAR
ncbi:hypothetical protein C2E23DRAFT_829176 [Lenzites betulinus]|nr:hypothetical protein C2E23DRAFT_829176 [Lenzites betulinus]